MAHFSKDYIQGLEYSALVIITSNAKVSMHKIKKHKNAVYVWYILGRKELSVTLSSYNYK